ncbi:hypothetical protein D6833_06735, partial [Candidatus Parcubacteria bacterium]
MLKHSIRVFQRPDAVIDPRVCSKIGAMIAKDSAGRFNIDETEELLEDLLDPIGPMAERVAQYVAEHHSDWVEKNLVAGEGEP